MTISLPLDVIDSILSYLCGTASIAECALVCRSWLPSARYHLLLPPKALHLDQVETAEFLRLIDSPGSTLSFVTFNTLDLRQNTVADSWNDPPRGDEWRSEVAVRDFLQRNLISLCSVTSLFLGWVDWRTLSPAAVNSLHSNFTSVKELTLQCIALDLPEFCRLLVALTALEKVTIADGVRFDLGPSTMNTVQISHPSLRHLAFDFPSGSCMVQFFARAIEYTSGITSVSIASFCNTEELKVCGELLETAGTNLRALNLRLRAPKLGTSSPDTDDSVYHKLLEFPHNKNLQEIDIRPVEESTIMPLLQGLKMKPNLNQLRLGLNRPNDLERWTGWPLVDDVLSAMVLKEPKLIVDIPILYHSWDYAEHPLEVLEASEKTHVEKSFERLKNMLPRTAQYWTFEVGMPSSSKLTYLRWTPVQSVQY